MMEYVSNQLIVLAGPRVRTVPRSSIYILYMSGEYIFYLPCILIISNDIMIIVLLVNNLLY